MSYDPGVSGISGANDVFLNNPAGADALSYDSGTSKWVNSPVDKARVGLSNVDNTSDASKPVSTATQTALNAKANSASLATVATSGSYNDLINTPSGAGGGGVVQLELQSTSGQSSTADLTLIPITVFDAISISQGGSDLHADLANHSIVIDISGVYDIEAHVPFTTCQYVGDRNAIIFRNVTPTELSSGWPPQARWIAHAETVHGTTSDPTNNTDTIHPRNTISLLAGDVITVCFLQHNRESPGPGTIIIGEDPGQRVSLTAHRIL